MQISHDGLKSCSAHCITDCQIDHIILFFPIHSSKEKIIVSRNKQECKKCSHFYFLYSKAMIILDLCVSQCLCDHVTYDKVIKEMLEAFGGSQLILKEVRLLINPSVVALVTIHFSPYPGSWNLLPGPI